MKKMLKLTSFILVLSTLLCLFCSCTSTMDTSKPNEPNTPPTNTPNSTTPSTPDENKDSQFVNPLTGLACEEGDVLLRPVAIMIDNEVNYFSGNYSNLGLSSADIIFETNIESNGSGTRMMPIFSQKTLKNNLLVIGGVRSARPYFMQLAKMLDAYYVHEGSSSRDDVVPSSITDYNYYARPMLHSGYVDSYELAGEGKISYRPEKEISDKLCVVSSAMVANGEQLLNHLTATYPRTTYKTQTATNAFLFGAANMSGGTDALSVRIRFSDDNAFYTQSKFTYDSATGIYVRSQYLYQSSLRGLNKNDIASKDINTGELLKFKNVFVLSTNQYACDRSYDGLPYHTKIDLVGYSGTGYYFTEGKCIEITWKCQSDLSPIRFYTSNGAELVVNPGKTFINLINQNALSDLEIA